MAKVIFHIDLNAFFANAEIILDPSLANKPIAISGTSRRSVISTASYEARQYGVHSAMPTAMALQKCPDLILVKGHYDFYEKLSNDFIRLVMQYSDLVQKASIDECYVDMTKTIKKYKKPLDLAWEIQQRLLHEYKLKCSIGVAPNMFLAKMASDMKKPMGITVLRIRDVEKKLWPLPIEDMRGVGSKTAPLLRDLNINTIGDLVKEENYKKLQEVFGNNTDSVIERAKGYDDSELELDWDAKSMSVSSTSLSDLAEYEEQKRMLLSLSEELSYRLKFDDKRGNTVTLKIKYDDFVTNTRQTKLKKYIYKKDDIFEVAIKLFDENVKNEPIRLLGIGVSNFKSIHDELLQYNLFEKEDVNETTKVINEINTKLKDTKLQTAAKLLKEDKLKKNGTK